MELAREPKAVIGLSGIAGLEAEMRDRLAAKNAEIERLRRTQADLVAALRTARGAIDKGIPIPKRMLLSGRRSSAHSEALKKLQVGESIVFPAKQGEPMLRTQNRATGLVSHFRPKKFSTRRIMENGKTILRVWRVA